eukprot:1804075-Pleurochrysis_carterae.AAC.1
MSKRAKREGRGDRPLWNQFSDSSEDEAREAFSSHNRRLISTRTGGLSNVEESTRKEERRPEARGERAGEQKGVYDNKIESVSEKQDREAAERVREQSACGTLRRSRSFGKKGGATLASSRLEA